MFTNIQICLQKSRYKDLCLQFRNAFGISLYHRPFVFITTAHDQR